VNQRGYRIRLRMVYPFILSMTVAVPAVLFAIAFLATKNRPPLTLLLPTVVLLTLAYFLHKAGLSWIRISKDGKELVSVPSWYSRKLWGEHRVVEKIVPGSKLLFSRKSAYGGFDGYYVILRTPGGTDRVLWNDLSGMSRRYCERVAQEIRGMYQLDAHLVRQVVSNEGIQETDWSSESDRVLRDNIKLMIGPALFPYLGIAVRLLTSDPWKIALVGVLLWIVGISVFCYFYRTHEVAKEQSLSTTGLVWTLQFVGFYAVTVLATSAFLHR
jgi:hypothetical protein